MEEINAEFLTKEDVNCSDYKFIHILRSAIDQAMIDNRIHLWGPDIEDAREIIFPTIFNIVFNTYFDIRNDAKAINELIRFMLIHYA